MVKVIDEKKHKYNRYYTAISMLSQLKAWNTHLHENEVIGVLVRNT